jgi:hypothetical protein
MYDLKTPAKLVDHAERTMTKMSERAPHPDYTGGHGRKQRRFARPAAHRHGNFMIFKVYRYEWWAL